MNGRQNDAPTAKDVHVLIPRTCKYIRVRGREGKTVADGIQIATQLTLKQEDYPGLFRWAQGNHRGSLEWKSGVEERDPERCQCNDLVKHQIKGFGL